MPAWDFYKGIFFFGKFNEFNRLKILNEKIYDGKESFWAFKSCSFGFIILFDWNLIFIRIQD